MKATITIKETKETIKNKKINLYSYEDIEQILTNKVSGFIKLGYRFYSYNGTQGESAKVSLTKDGKTVFIFRLEKCYSGNQDAVKLYIKRYDNVVRDKILWSSEGVLVEETKYIQITKKASAINGRKIKYVDNLEDFQEIEKIQLERKQRNYVSDFIVLPESLKKYAWNIVKNLKGCKSVKKSDIESLEKHDRNYLVRVKNRYNVIWLN